MVDSASAVNLVDIIKFVGESTRPLVEGSLLAKSKSHYVMYGVLPYDTSSCELIFKASCITSTISAKPHDLEVHKKIKSDGVGLKGICSCKAGMGRCKHIVGLMLKLEK